MKSSDVVEFLWKRKFNSFTENLLDVSSTFLDNNLSEYGIILSQEDNKTLLHVPLRSL